MTQNGLKMIGKSLLEARMANFVLVGHYCVKNATNKIESPMTKSGQDEIWGPKLKLKHVRFGLLCVKNATNKIDSPMTKSGQSEV